MRRRTAPLAVGLVSVLAACGLQPLPNVAAPGSTITIVVPPAFAGGFGRVIDGDPADHGVLMATNVAPEEDLQRGELIFRLQDTNPLDPENFYFLHREFVTRVGVDASAPAALRGEPGVLSSGQIVALVTIPGEVEVGPTYEIVVERYRRSEADGFFERIPTYYQNQVNEWRGWGTNSSNNGIPIDIVDCSVPGDCPDRATPRQGWAGLGDLPWQWGPGDVTTTDLTQMTPYPTLQVRASNVQPAGSCLAAWELEVDYAVEKIFIHGVSTYGHVSDEAYVHHSANPWVAGVCDNNPQKDRLSIQIVSPDCSVEEISIAFQAKPGIYVNCPNEGGRAVLDDFEVIEHHGYDQDGNEISYDLVKLDRFM